MFKSKALSQKDQGWEVGVGGDLDNKQVKSNSYLEQQLLQVQPTLLLKHPTVTLTENNYKGMSVDYNKESEGSTEIGQSLD